MFSSGPEFQIPGVWMVLVPVTWMRGTLNTNPFLFISMGIKDPGHITQADWEKNCTDRREEEHWSHRNFLRWNLSLLVIPFSNDLFPTSHALQKRGTRGCASRAAEMNRTDYSRLCVIEWPIVEAFYHSLGSVKTEQLHESWYWRMQRAY